MNLIRQPESFLFLKGAGVHVVLVYLGINAGGGVSWGFPLPFMLEACMQ